MSYGIQCVLSEITYRDDDLWRKAKEVNRMMRNDLPSNVKIIDNTNISERHLNSRSLHLNQRGSRELALNPISAGGGGGGIHPPPSFSLAIATKINRSTPNFLTFNFYYRDII